MKFVVVDSRFKNCLDGVLGFGVDGNGRRLHLLPLGVGIGLGRFEKRNVKNGVDFHRLGEFDFEGDVVNLLSDCVRSNLSVIELLGRAIGGKVLGREVNLLTNVKGDILAVAVGVLLEILGGSKE